MTNKKSVEEKVKEFKEESYREKKAKSARIVDAFNKGMKKEIEEQLANGIPVTFSENGYVVRLHPDGHKEIVKKIEPFDFDWCKKDE